MTTQIVQGITDEQLAELEGMATAAAPAFGEFGPSDAEQDFMASIRPMAVLALIARLRDAEMDARRYRWLRDKSVDTDGVYPMVSLTDESGDQVSNWLFGHGVDRAVDEAMERTP